MKKPSIWSALFRGAPVDATTKEFGADQTSASDSIRLKNGWLSLVQPRFHGQAVLAPNKRWAVGRFSPPRASGSQVQMSGRTVLVDMDRRQVLHDLSCFSRPMNIAVSDIGLYVVHDTSFESTLQADLMVISRAGEVAVRRRYSANLVNLGLSPCGRYVASQAANAPGSPDGSKLELLDIQTRKRVFSVLPPPGWADRYSFVLTDDGQLKFLCVHFKRLGSFRFGPDGNFLDQALYEEKRLTQGDFTERILAAQDLVAAKDSPADLDRALRAVTSALEIGAKDRPDWAAQAYRTQGDAHEALGQLPEALASYRRALDLNPKIGVKKKVSSIEKRLQPPSTGR